MQEVTFKVSSADKGLRLDHFIIKNLELPISRSRIQRLIKTGMVFVNEKPAKAHYKVRENDALRVNIPPVQPSMQVSPEEIPLDIVFEDEDILVINKPSGMVTHPAAGCYSGTLVNALLHYGCPLSTVNGPLRPGIVHRLDKDTTGLLVIAKNDFAHLGLAKQFRSHTVRRKYIALVKGKVAHDEGQIEMPIARDPHHRQKMAVSFHKKSRPALTRYKVLKRLKSATLLELIPHTGRTHQLRVHLKFHGHPILGDTRYGRGGDFERLALHAKVLGFQHPRTGKFVEFQSGVPENFMLYCSHK
ncbi:MAG: RluA family pseudouridine synthase [Candidatus Omnitrophota bacterium]|nr:MAG: RluA family pseudouridine synthase [Candidatus Omnitrophota bacterium]